MNGRVKLYDGGGGVGARGSDVIAIRVSEREDSAGNGPGPGVGSELKGFGGVEYIANLLGCDPKTIRQGRADLADLPDVPPEQVRKKGGTQTLS